MCRGKQRKTFSVPPPRRKKEEGGETLILRPWQIMFEKRKSKKTAGAVGKKGGWLIIQERRGREEGSFITIAQTMVWRGKSLTKLSSKGGGKKRKAVDFIHVLQHLLGREKQSFARHCRKRNQRLFDRDKSTAENRAIWIK